MRLAVLGHVLGQFLLGLLGLLLIPLAVSLWSQNDTGPLINAAVIIPTIFCQFKEYFIKASTIHE